MIAYQFTFLKTFLSAHSINKKSEKITYIRFSHLLIGQYISFSDNVL